MVFIMNNKIYSDDALYKTYWYMVLYGASLEYRMAYLDKLRMIKNDYFWKTC